MTKKDIINYILLDSLQMTIARGNYPDLTHMGVQDLDVLSISLELEKELRKSLKLAVN